MEKIRFIEIMPPIPIPNYALHFEKRVEFWTLDGKKLLESKIIEVIE